MTTSFTEQFENYLGDGDSWGTFEFYQNFYDLLCAAIASGEPFDTGWKGVKKEIMSFRIRRYDSGKFCCQVSVSDDFDTEGMGEEQFGVSPELGTEETIDVIREALSRAFGEAEDDRRDSACYTGFSIYQLRPDGSLGGWKYTFIWPKNGDTEFPPTGDNYYFWGWQEGELTEDEYGTEVCIGPPADEMTSASREMIEDWCRAWSGSEPSMIVKCWKVLAWADE